MQIAIIGAGVSGLAMARLLSNGNKVVVYEKDQKAGGLIKCDEVDGNLFHTTGGHVFNTKHQHVLDWFWQLFDREREFVKADRNASIVIGDKNIGYPIENHVYQLDDQILTSFINDLTDIIKDESVPTNFEEFLVKRFGMTLYQLYFKPYNEKVWKRDLSKVPLSWLEGKLPMPTATEMIYNNIRQVEEKKFVHSTFYYPKKGGSQFIADRLAQGLDIRYGHDINSIDRKGGKWIIDGAEYDAVVYTGNIKALPKALHGLDITAFEKQINALEYHGTTSVFCEIDRNPYSWIYMPSKDYAAHRIICTGNFSESNNRSERLTATVEFTDYIGKDDILDNLSKMPYAPRYLSQNYEKYTYPIQDSATRNMIASLKGRLAKEGIYLTGRFADWEYYNMDAAIAAAMITNKYIRTEAQK